MEYYCSQTYLSACKPSDQKRVKAGPPGREDTQKLADSIRAAGLRAEAPRPPASPAPCVKMVLGVFSWWWLAFRGGCLCV